MNDSIIKAIVALTEEYEAMSTEEYEEYIQSVEEDSRLSILEEFFDSGTGPAIGDEPSYSTCAEFGSAPQRRRLLGETQEYRPPTNIMFSTVTVPVHEGADSFLVGRLEWAA